MKDQLVVLKELGKIRDKIHSLCAKTKCIKFNRCKKASTVCTNDDQSPFRKLIRNNGGNFERYLNLRTQLMEYNYPLVISQASAMGGYSTDDLCQEGILGLCEAIDRFDISQGNQFSTYAYHYIKKTILDFMRINNTVKLANRISYLSKITEEAFDSLVQKNNSLVYTITEKQLIKEITKLRAQKKMKPMSIRPNEIKGHLNRLKLQLTTADLLPLEPNKYDYQEHSDSFYNLLNRELNSDLENVPIQIAEAIKLRFGLGEYDTPTPIQEVGAIIGVTRQSIEYHIKEFFQRK